jgi:predicted RNase H-like HicB family nuclease
VPTTAPAAPGRPASGAEPRWFGHGREARAMARKETVVADGRTFQAVFRRCAGGGFVVSLPAVPHLMTHAATNQHARVKAIALAHGYLHEPRATGRLAPPLRSNRPSLRLALAA